GVRVDAFRPRRSLDAAELSCLELLRDRLRLGPGPVVLYVGTLAPEKGNDVLLRAFSLVRERVPDASLLLVGRHNRYFQVSAPRGRGRRREARLRQRDYPQEIAALVSELGDRVVLVDGVRHEELAAYYALADVFVMPSTGQEPFPLPVLEALASELPVVATRRGGLPEIVRDGVDGALVPAGDPAALAAALEALCADPAARRELGARGRTLVEREFTWAHHARRLLTLYEAIAAPAADSLRSAAAPALT
ncbi:MAG TPA: glycosyltransferase family 4 protein, partial [Gaiellaceae bacterium]|nr:glycosyltransferase family 4 protein [Gaiellaceae bacterium]